MEDSRERVLRDLEIEDANNSRETVDGVTNQIKLETYKTTLQKDAFIRDLRIIGDEIKKNPNKVIFLQDEKDKAELERRNNLSRWAKFKEIMVKFFTKF